MFSLNFDAGGCCGTCPIVDPLVFLACLLFFLLPNELQCYPYNINRRPTSFGIFVDKIFKDGCSYRIVFFDITPLKHGLVYGRLV